jgi:hypothetical protein
MCKRILQQQKQDAALSDTKQQRLHKFSTYEILSSSLCCHPGAAPLQKVRNTTGGAQIAPADMQYNTTDNWQKSVVWLLMGQLARVGQKHPRPKGH